MKVFKLVVVLCLLLTGCRSPAADAAVIAARDGGNEGAKIYTRNCGKCHEFYPPSNYTQAEWDKWMVKMRRKSKLKAADFDRVQEFTQLLRNGEGQAPKKR